MATEREKVRLIFGLKLKQLRTEAGISTYELANRTGLSPSYITEIEKGKKYPKTEKVFALAKALETDYDSLVSLKVSKQLEPVLELLNSNILSELQLDMFGLEPGYFLEIMANAPAKMSAFISTLIEIGRNYDMRVEQFYFSVLRAYQEMHGNYFDDLEQEADRFLTTHPLPADGQPNGDHANSDWLTDVLTSVYTCRITYYDQITQPALTGLRSVFLPEKNELLINRRLSAEQRAFTLAREVGYHWLKLTVRPLESSVIEARSFDEVLNNSKASYFARAVLIPRQQLLEQLTRIVSQPDWQDDRLVDAMRPFAVTPEMFLLRVTNLLTSQFGLNDLFFLRFNHPLGSQRFDLAKEMHLSKLHTPHGTALDEHYCRRQVAITILTDLDAQQQANTWNGQPLCRTQITNYVTDQTAYFVISVAKPSPPKAENSSISIGFPLDDHLRSTFAFLNDPAIPRTDVGGTCERCPIADCTVRAAPPVVLLAETGKKNLQATIAQLRL